MNGDKKFPYNQYKKLLSGAWQTKLRKDSANLTYWFDFARSAPMLEASASMAGHSAALGNAVHNYNHIHNYNQLAIYCQFVPNVMCSNPADPIQNTQGRHVNCQQILRMSHDVTGRRGQIVLARNLGCRSAILGCWCQGLELGNSSALALDVLSMEAADIAGAQIGARCVGTGACW